jgi:hypothetical protein
MVRSRRASEAGGHFARSAILLVSVALRGPRLLLRVKILLAEWNTVSAKRRLIYGSRMTQYPFAWLRRPNADQASAATTSPFR